MRIYFSQEQGMTLQWVYEDHDVPMGLEVFKGIIAGIQDEDERERLRKIYNSLVDKHNERVDLQ